MHVRPAGVTRGASDPEAAGILLFLHQLHIVDNKKAERLSRLVGFQLPQALIASSYNMNLAPGQKNVNNKISVVIRLFTYLISTA